MRGGSPLYAAGRQRPDSMHRLWQGLPIDLHATLREELGKRREDRDKLWCAPLVLLLLPPLAWPPAVAGASVAAGATP